MKNRVGPAFTVRQTTSVVIALLCAPWANARMLGGLPTSVRPLPRSVLASLRGRYIGGSEVTYFGLAMSSQWTDSSGTTGAGAQLALNLEGRHRLSLRTYTTGQAGGEKSDAGASSTPLSSVAGVGQSVQLVGNSNAVHNTAAINIVSTPEVVGIGSSSLAGVGPQGGNGQVFIAHNSVSVGIRMPGRGSVSQTLSAQGLMQNVEVASSANTVFNQMVLTVGLKNVAGVSNLALGQILTSLRGVE